jgi:hypothetical protein
MKRKFLYVLGFLFLVAAFNSCEGIKNCKICKQVTYDSSGSVLYEDNESEYCDAALVRIEATPDVTVSGVTTKWVCR